MKHLLVAAALLFASTPVYGQSMGGDNGVGLEIKRLDQRLNRVTEKNEMYLRQIRELERQYNEMKKEAEFLSKKATMAIDDVTKMRNTDIANLVATDKQLADRINSIANHIEEQTPVWDWGSKERNCEGVGEHLQIQSVKNAQNTHTMRFLCFDGRPIHLSTEVNMPPQ